MGTFFHRFCTVFSVFLIFIFFGQSEDMKNRESKQEDDDDSTLLPKDEYGFCCIPARVYNHPMWNIFMLALAWALTLTTSTLLTTVGPLSSKELGASDSLASFTVGTFLIGAAVSSVPSAQIFARFGRFIGFSMGCLCQIAGSLFGALAMLFKNKILLFTGCFFVGLAQGLGQFYRFSAVEVSPEKLKSRAVTYVLTGGVLAAFLGPTGAANTANIVPNIKYLASYLLMALVGVLNEIVIAFVNFPKRPRKVPNRPRRSDFANDDITIDMLPSTLPRVRSTLEIISQPLFLVSCAVATLAHTNMTMLMSNVTLAMTKSGYGFQACSLVLEFHFFAMFAPGFITGKLIGHPKIGSFNVALMGGLILAASSVTFITGSAEWNYFLGMILLGIGWNFSFSAGTVMLTGSYLPHEATNVQAVNDFILFTVAGSGSLLSGFIFSSFGWFTLVIVASGIMVIYLLLFIVARNIKTSSVHEALSSQEEVDEEPKGKNRQQIGDSKFSSHSHTTIDESINPLTTIAFNDDFNSMRNASAHVSPRASTYEDSTHLQSETSEAASFLSDMSGEFNEEERDIAVRTLSTA